MKRINQRITIAGKVLPYVTNVEIVDTRNQLANTAVLTLPNLADRFGVKISDVIAPGSAIRIELGYFPELNVEFEGFVSQIIPDKVAVIRCEDFGYVAKRQNVGKDIVLKNTTISKLIAKVYTGSFLAPDDNIGNWKVAKTANVQNVLAELNSKFKAYSYWRGETLIVGANADTYKPKLITLGFQRNIIAGESNFNFKTASADRSLVKATHIKRNGVITEAFAYYEGSPSKVVTSRVKPAFSSAMSEINIGGQDEFRYNDLAELAKQKLKAISYTGLDGGVTIYGSPRFTHGDIAKIENKDVKAKSGTFAVVEVVRRFGRGIGYRQDLKLGINFPNL